MIIRKAAPYLTAFIVILYLFAALGLAAFAEPDTNSTTGEMKITKNPTSETVKEGGQAIFIAAAENYYSMEWRIQTKDTSKSWTGKTVIESSFTGVKFEAYVEDDNREYLVLSNVPASLNGYYVVALFRDAGDKLMFTDGRAAKITVTAEDGTAITTQTDQETSPEPVVTPEPSAEPEATPVPEPTPEPTPAQETAAESTSEPTAAPESPVEAYTSDNEAEAETQKQRVKTSENNKSQSEGIIPAWITVAVLGAAVTVALALIIVRVNNERDYEDDDDE